MRRNSMISGSWPSLRVQGEQSASPTVLLVEDDRDIRSVLAECLDCNGFGVTEAETAETAATLLEQGMVPLAVVTDVNLGSGQTGLWLADRLAASHIAVPVIFITGRMDMMRDRTLRPAEHVLPTPFPLSALIGLLGRATSRPDAAARPTGRALR